MASMKKCWNRILKSWGYVFILSALSLGNAAQAAWRNADDFWFLGLQIGIFLLMAPVYFMIKNGTSAPFGYILSTLAAHLVFGVGGSWVLDRIYDSSGIGDDMFLGGIEISLVVAWLTIYVGVILLFDLLLMGCKAFLKRLEV